MLWKTEAPTGATIGGGLLGMRSEVSDEQEAGKSLGHIVTGCYIL